MISASRVFICAKCGALSDKSWCKQCREANTHRWARENIAHRRTSNYLQDGDALKYSRSVCDHVAVFVERKIKAFELRHGIEAPPHLTALAEIARSVSAQHPDESIVQSNYVPCLSCATPVARRAGSSRVLCGTCRRIRRKERERVKSQRRKLIEQLAKEPRTPPWVERLAEAQDRADKRDHKARQAAALRNTGAKWQDISDELGYSGPGAAFTAATRIDPHLKKRKAT